MPYRTNRAGPLAEHVTQSRACAQQYYIRNLKNLSLYKCRTERFKNTFFPRAIAELNATKYRKEPTLD